MNQLQHTLTSLEVAEMVGREHNNVMKDIRRIIEHLGEVTSHQSYFIESTYVNSQNREMPCFKLTKKGCELFGTRMTGEKGTRFAVEYIERFNKMESELQQPMSPSELALLQAQNMVDLEKRVNEQDNRLEKVETEQKNMAEIINLNPVEWRKKVTSILNRIANNQGGFEMYRTIRNESYKALEERGRCNLNIRVINKQKAMALNGVAKSRINKVSKLDAIADDARLTEIYLAIVKELAIKYRVNINDVELNETAGG